MSRSQTPITDAAASDGWSGDAVAVDPDVARSLERQLRVARGALKRIRRVAYMPGHTSDEREIAQKALRQMTAIHLKTWRD